MASKFVNDTEIELYKRNFEIKKAAYDMEVETARAQAELAFQLQVGVGMIWLIDIRYRSLQAAKVHQKIKEL